jgi:chemotaxis protein CheC
MMDTFNITAEDRDAITELVNIGVGYAAGILNDMLSSPIKLQVPVVEIHLKEALDKELEKLYGEVHSLTYLNFQGSLGGNTALYFSLEDAQKLVAMVTGQEPGTDELDALKAGTMSEIGNIIINGVVGTISNLINADIQYQLPVYAEASLNDILSTMNVNDKHPVLVAKTGFEVEGVEIRGDYVMILELDSYETLIKSIREISQNNK